MFLSNVSIRLDSASFLRKDFIFGPYQTLIKTINDHVEICYFSNWNIKYSSISRSKSSGTTH